MPDLRIENTITEKIQSAWLNIREELREKLQAQQYYSFIEPIQLLSEKDFTLIFACPNSFCREWASAHYAPLIRQKIQELTSEPFILEFIVAGNPKAPPATTLP